MAMVLDQVSEAGGRAMVLDQVSEAGGRGGIKIFRFLVEGISSGATDVSGDRG